MAIGHIASKISYGILSGLKQKPYKSVEKSETNTSGMREDSCVWVSITALQTFGQLFKLSTLKYWRVHFQEHNWAFGVCFCSIASVLKCAAMKLNTSAPRVTAGDGV